MSRENLEVVREALDAVNRRDLDRYLSHCTNDVVLTGPLRGEYKGPEGIRRYVADIEADVSDWRVEVDRLDALGDDRVVGFMRNKGTGRASGVSTESITTIYDLVDRKISRIRPGFRDRAAALKAVGLQA